MAKNAHILIVEDEPVSAAMIEHQLVQLGYGVSGIARTGEDAIALTESCQPDLVLMDIGLEGEMDGVEAANVIQRRFEIPVIYLTGNSDEATIGRASSTEAHGYLHKPIAAAILHSSLQMALAKAALESSVREERKWLVTTLRCISDGVIAVDSLGAVKLLNTAAEKMTGWSQDDAVNRDLSEVFRVLEPDTRAILDSAIVGLVTGESEVVYSRKILVSRDGTETRVEETAAAITDAAGFMTGIVLVFHRTSL
jgi:two-component system cell cycle sensor histidine kinase/response regulator CckA